jgi:peptide/nickel transport system permease protein
VTAGTGAFPRVGVDRPQAWGRALTRFATHKPLGAAGAVVLTGLFLIAIFATSIAPYPENAVFVGPALEGPSNTHWFGTDNLGRDLLSRVLVGARPSLYTGLLVVTVGVTLGTLLGVTSAYAGGVFDIGVQRIVDGFMALPGLVLALAVVAVIPANESWSRIGGVHMPVAIALVVGSIPGTSRLIRSTALSLKQSAFVEAARTVGAGPGRIILRHIVPNVFAPAIVVASVQLGGVILAEASLSFLGLGAPPPDPTWGRTMSQEGRQFLEVAPWLAIFPGVAISLVVLAFNLLGDALRDVLDPRMRGT